MKINENIREATSFLLCPAEFSVNSDKNLAVLIANPKDDDCWFSQVCLIRVGEAELCTQEDRQCLSML